MVLGLIQNRTSAAQRYNVLEIKGTHLKVVVN